MDLIKSGGIINSDVTAQDVYRASQIFGADLASVKGKTVTIMPEAAKLEYIPKPTQEELTLHTDIMFVERDPYLVSVSTPLGLTMCTHLGGKRTESVVTRALRDPPPNASLFARCSQMEKELFLLAQPRSRRRASLLILQARGSMSQ